ncbi:hypothetical protein EDB92DRAFT_1821158 [Lactarius akahatsu]|uniref:Uncharacterized protein n=1 Tax=Lactarius akahatsu TaxID=416441 RepID=A0AAD4L3U6_9AGAM|nr:hypothetical protein EDB92DRAFT_1821158 [Lactarius akahatsu]
MEEYHQPHLGSDILVRPSGSASASATASALSALPSSSNILPTNAQNSVVTHLVGDASATRLMSAGGPVGPVGDVDRHSVDPAQATIGADGASTEAPFYRKRSFLISQAIGALVGIGLFFVLLYPVVRAIAQHVVDASTLNVDRVEIAQPSNTSFSLRLDGWVTAILSLVFSHANIFTKVAHAGIFSAQIVFTQPLRVSWVNGTEEIQIGRFTLEPLKAKKKRAFLNQTTEFSVTDQEAFGRFTQYMITASNFTWRLRSDQLYARALKFPISKGLSYKKDLTLKGINSFEGNVVLKEFQLPSDSPEGGINFISVRRRIPSLCAALKLKACSPFQLNLGTVVFNLFYNKVYLGQGVGTNTTIAPGPNDITLRGRLVPHNGSDTELAAIGQLFSRYINGDTSPVIAQGVSTLQNDNTSIFWLSEGLQALRLNVPFKSPTPINPLQSISIGELSLAFSETQPWAPVANSHSVHASMHLPFGFNVEIGQIENAFNISKNGSAIAGLTTPLGATTSDIHVLNSTDTEGTINITIVDTALSVPKSSEPYFSSFNAELTDLDYEHFRLEGHARAVANMSLGTLTLDPIKFNVSSGLWGLKGLQGLVSIDGVDVLGGTQDAMSLAINVTIDNPSNLNLGLGDLVSVITDVVFQLLKGNALLGTTIMPNLTLFIGNNSIPATSAFSPDNSPDGQQVLNNFVGKKDSVITIAGYHGSTKISSLLQAFETINLNVTLPGLKTNLLSSAALTVLPTTGRENNIAHVSVALVNPFTAGLLITSIRSAVSTHGISLGTIETHTNFTSTGKSTVISPSFDIGLNMDPAALFTVTRLCAVSAGLSTEQLDGIVQLGGYRYLQVTGGNSSGATKKRRDNLYTRFNLPNFVDTAFKQLHSDVQLEADVQIGDYKTTLQFTQPSVPISTDQTLNLLLPLLAQPIVQKIVSGSTLGVNSVLITNPTANSFGARLSGSITQAGPFDAEISFGTGLTIAWSGQPLGSIKMPNINITGDVGAQFEVEATFEIADVGHLTDFTKVLLTQESFDWVISGENLSGESLYTPVWPVQKTVTLKGLNNLKNAVLIKSFDLPADDPAGGIHLTLDTAIANPSQVGISLSNIGFQTYFGNTNIGMVASNGSFTLAPLATSSLGLIGRLIPQTQQSGLLDVSTIFNNFIHGLDSNVSVHGDSAGRGDATWLNEGIKSLVVETVLPNRGKLDVIKSIELNELDLRFTEGTAYDPSTSSNDATAAFTLPFNFPVDIKALGEKISVSTGGTPFSELIIPKGPAFTDVQQRIVHLKFSDVPFSGFGDQREAFQQFLASTTTSTNQTMGLSGKADTDADTAIGLLSLTDIDFSVTTSIAGLQGLSAKPTLVTSLDVNHGFPDYLLIKVNSSLFNPSGRRLSNITLGAGDVKFGLFFQQVIFMIGLKSNSEIWSQESANWHGRFDVHFQPQGGSVSAGQALLENYLQGVTSETTIQGSQDSTKIDSLKVALSEIRLTPVEIPALHQNLISSASLELPTNIVQTGIASASFTLDNPFTASINLLEVTTTVTYQQLTIGIIDHVDLSSSPVHVNGHSTVTSSQLPFKFNLNPITIIQLLSSGAQNNHVDLGPLTQLFGIVVQNPDYRPPITTTVSTEAPTCVSGKQFDVAAAVLDALKNLKVTLKIDSLVKIDDYPTELAFNQTNVTALTDQTALYLIGAVAPPVVQTLVDGANLTFSAANITNLSDGGFDLALRGALTNIGPLDALIEFEEPVIVTWQGHDIATIGLPSSTSFYNSDSSSETSNSSLVCAAANSGVPDYRASGRLTITDEGQFTAFATFLLHNPSFTWTIHTDKLRVTALGTIFDGVSLSKDVTFKAFNGLPGVTISNFQLPSDDPAGGIHIETDSLIPSPAQLGIDLGTVSFQAFFEGTVIGPLSTTSLALAPESVTNAHLSGRISPKSGSDLNAIGKLFSQFLAGKNQTLSVQGDSVQPTGTGTVGWIIDSITLSDLEIAMTEQNQVFAPLASSQHTLATYKNPFGFSLQVIQSAEDIFLGASGSDVAELKLPQSDTVGGVSTGNEADLEIVFSKQPLQSLNNAVFAAFFAAVTDTQSVEFELKGSADVVARTTIGDVPISNIPFNVTSALRGIDSFGHTAGLSNVSITGSGGNGGNEYVNADITTTLQNPSNISLQTNDVSLAVFYKDVKIGRAAINTLNLFPGENTVATEFHYEPDNANDTTAQSFLSQFLQSGDALPLFIKGDQSSSPYSSLVPALEGVSLTTSLAGFNAPPIITHINVYVPLSAIVDSLVSIDFDIANPLDTDMHITFAQADAGVDGETFARFDQPFTGFSVPARGTANSGKFGNVLAYQGSNTLVAYHPVGSPRRLRGGDSHTRRNVDIDIGVVAVSAMAGISLGDFEQALKNTTANTPSSGSHVLSNNDSVPPSVPLDSMAGDAISGTQPRQTALINRDRVQIRG